jgi:hypothetical protein
VSGTAQNNLRTKENLSPPAARFDLDQNAGEALPSIGSMPVFLYRCPNTGLKVQGWVADDPKPQTDATYEAVTCTACTRVHMVNPSTERVLGSDDE